MTKAAESAKYLWTVGVRGVLRLTRSDIVMAEDDRASTGVLYMQRLTLEFGPRRRTVRLHVIHRADVDNCLHDHPWPFWGLVLWGGYVEEIPPQSTTVEEATRGYPRRIENHVRPWRIFRRSLNYKHRIVRLKARVSVTLAFSGPISQGWGFYTRNGKTSWENFESVERSRRVFWCDVSD